MLPVKIMLITTTARRKKERMGKMGEKEEMKEDKDK